ncbi:Uncharacterised protein [Mycobacterium tuberculosis]|nr:Uncharacterised protein [Mycobacterium tuberculosis]
MLTNLTLGFPLNRSFTGRIALCNTAQPMQPVYQKSYTTTLPSRSEFLTS